MTTRTKDVSLSEAKLILEQWQRTVRRLQDAQCRERGHVKGGGAWEGVFYCACCGSQLPEGEFTS